MQKITITLFKELMDNLSEDMHYTLHTGWSQKYPPITKESLLDLLEHSVQDEIYFAFFRSSLSNELCVAVSDRKGKGLVFSDV